jgi:hypothetical protein
MSFVVLICAGLVGISPPVSAADRATYEAARAQAGSDAGMHVKLALWCETHGMNAERAKHLAQAVLADPKNAAARGLLGLIAYRGQWLTPEKISEAQQEDETLTAKLAAYNARRAELQKVLDRDQGAPIERRKAARAHEQLGIWCQQQGLQAEATAHFTTAVQLNPYNDATWKRLGYVKRGGLWLSRVQAATEEKEARANRIFVRHWEPLLKKWKGWLGDNSRKAAALENFAQIVDPRAVPSIVATLGSGTPDHQLIAVETLARIDGPAASKELARLAVLGGSAAVRAAATEALKGRVLRDFGSMLVETIRSPIRYEIQPVQGPGSQGALMVETTRFRMLRTYDAPPAFQLARSFRGYVGYAPDGMPVVAAGAELDRLRLQNAELQAVNLERIKARTLDLLAAANLKAMATQQLIADDVTAIEAFNAESAALNQRVIPVLQSVAAAPDLKNDENAWNTWWYDRLGYRFEPPQQVPVFENRIPYSAGPTMTTCFAAGTPVRTVSGPRPIETIQVGDHVLAQDVTTGRLGFEPVLVVHHNPPGKTLRIALEGGESLVASVYHRFWLAGLGWVTARELKPGDRLRTLGGLVRVTSIETGTEQPVYNLTVASSWSFFVGQTGALVHDNTLPDARLEPFDAVPRIKPAQTPVE